MSASAMVFKMQFDLHTRLYRNVLSGVSDMESHLRSDEHINHIKWVAGHLLNSRLNSMSKAAGLQPDESYIPVFGRGTSLSATAAYPAIEEIIHKWDEVSAAISARIGHIPEEVLSAPAAVKTPIHDDTVRGMVAFMLSHEAYHIGQLSLLRKMAGKEAMSFQ